MPVCGASSSIPQAVARTGLRSRKSAIAAFEPLALTSTRRSASRVLLPGALRRVLPQYSNEVVGLVHATAIASTVTLVDITRVARDVNSQYLLVTESCGVAAVIYFVLTFTLVGIFKLLERRYLRHLRPQSAAAAAS